MRNNVSSRASNLDAQVDRHNIAEDFQRRRQLARTRINAGENLLAYINWNLTTSGDSSQGVLCDRSGNSLGIVVEIDAIQSIINCQPQSFGYALYEIECCGVASTPGALAFAAVALSTVAPSSGLGTAQAVTGMDSSSRLLNAGALITNVVNGSTLNNFLPVAFTSGGSTDPSTYNIANPLSYAPTSSIPFPASIAPYDGTVFGASGTNHKKGLVPDPGAVAGAAKFLREDATWAQTPYPITIYPSGSAGSHDGLCPAPPLTAGTTKYLREDATWHAPNTSTLTALCGTNNVSGTTNGASIALAAGSVLSGGLTGIGTLPLGSFVATNAGTYLICMTCSMTAGTFVVGTNVGHVTWGISVGGFSAAQSLTYTPSSSNDTNLCVSGVFSLAASDSVTLRAYVNPPTGLGAASGSCTLYINQISVTKLP